MPQLNPAPWFVTLVITWLIFLAAVPPKVMAHLLPKEPTLPSTGNSDTGALAWTWTWL